MEVKNDIWLKNLVFASLPRLPNVKIREPQNFDIFSGNLHSDQSQTHGGGCYERANHSVNLPHPNSPRQFIGRHRPDEPVLFCVHRQRPFSRVFVQSAEWIFHRSCGSVLVTTKRRKSPCLPTTPSTRPWPVRPT